MPPLPGQDRSSGGSRHTGVIQATTSSEKDYLAQVLRDQAVIALGKIGPEARAIVPTLRRWLEGNQEGEVGWPGPERAIS